MKKKVFVVLAIVSFLLSACVKDVEEEGVAPDFIPHFSYGGYTYYIHPSLGDMNWDDANKACQELTAYGYSDWFLPSMGEFDAARYEGYKWGDIWSSSSCGSDCHYVLEIWYDDYNMPHYEWDGYYNSNMFKVVPMRKQAASTNL